MKNAWKAAGIALALGSSSCRHAAEESANAPTPSAPAQASEPDACRPCHAEVVTRWEASAHRLAARPFPASGVHASFAPDAAVSDLAKPLMSVRPPADLVVADAEGASEARPISHVLGGIRREDFLSPLATRRQILPVSWSVTRKQWVEPVAEELAGVPEAPKELAWTSERRSHERACSRCHPIAADGADAITCSSCHGDASAHVANRSGHADASTWARDTMRRATNDPWKGCATCHASAAEKPRSKGLGSEAPFGDRFLPATFAGPAGFDATFRLDGTPAIAHGMEVQSLVTSPCFLKGKATCTTCHDPHSASLKDADPDASCRSCHQEIAAKAAEHAKHRVAETPVPSSRQEPGGPAPTRLPGCVDCHAPALLPFGHGDLARDHAIGVPSPLLEDVAGISNSCTGCHPKITPDELARAVPARPEGPRARERRFLAFHRAVAGGGEKDARQAVSLLRQLLADGEQDAWTRASAAQLLITFGSLSAPALPELRKAWQDATDVQLALSAMNADARLGGSLPELKQRLDEEKDWRIALALGGGLAARGDERGAEAVEAIATDANLPDVARADAGSDFASILISQNACRRAASVLADSLSREPDSVPGWLNMGVARACLGDAPGARQAFEKVLELQPGHALALKNLESLDRALSASGATGATDAPK